VADPAVLSSFADGTLLVVDASRTHRRDVLRGRDTLSRAGANVLGVVLNRVPARRRDRLPGYRAFLETRSRAGEKPSRQDPA